ncbi:DUF2867 domain-containing protein [Actinophytocola sp.]|uniref:DUF2867 domain-containing protein n=1 Tax=Actinophytocola sp. TaxID=1872138 RepID=UPI003899D8E3
MLSDADMMRRYVWVADLHPRRILPVRPLSPWLSAHWVGLITPVPNAIARPLVASLVHEAVAREQDIETYSPGGQRPIGCDEAVRLALGKIRAERGDPLVDGDRLGRGGRAVAQRPVLVRRHGLFDERSREVHAPADALWRVIEAVGGDNGRYSFPLAWSIRWWLDRLAGGVGLRRGRRDAHRFRVGEELDWWRVEEPVPGRLLCLRAEMRVPGRACVEMAADPDGEGRTAYRQRAVFLPRGLAGHA